MKRLLDHILIVLMAMTVMSCEYEFKLKGTHEPPKLVIDCMATADAESQQGLVFVSVYGTIPVGDYYELTGSGLPVLEDPEVTVTVNGEKLTLNSLQIPSGDFVYYAMTSELCEGTEIKVHASAKGYPVAEGHTFVTGEADIIDASVSKDSLLTVKLDDNPATRDYYGLILRRYARIPTEIQPIDLDVQDSQTDSVLIDMVTLTGVEIGNGIKTSIDSYPYSPLGFFQGTEDGSRIVFFDDLSIKEQDNTFYAMVNEIPMAIYRGDYQLTVFKLSPETFRLIRALSVGDNPMMTEISAASSTYSGVSGGYGAVGAMRQTKLVLPSNY